MKGKKNKHVRVFEKTKLNKGEEIDCFLDGYIGKVMGSGEDAQHYGMLIVTNQRVSFYRKGVFGEVFETIPISKISSVESSSFMGYRELTFHTSNNDLSFKTFEKKEVYQKAYEVIETLRSNLDSHSTTNSSEQIRKIRELASLHAEGILSDTEFEKKKAEILDNL